MITGESAYFVPGGTDGEWEVFHATEHTVSAWGPELQHGSPPAALLTRAMERLDGGAGARIARVAVDLLGAIPPAEVRTRARVTRPGRRIQLLEAELLAGDRPVARASAWRLRTSDSSSAVHSAEAPRSLPEPGGVPSLLRWESGYLDSLDIREEPDGTAWARHTVALVAGEQMTPAERVMCIADTANGVGAVLDPKDWRFLNTDLVVHLHRLPLGEWIGVAAEASIGPDGVGTTAGTLYDTTGALGHSLQALLVEEV